LFLKHTNSRDKESTPPGLISVLNVLP